MRVLKFISFIMLLTFMPLLHAGSVLKIQQWQIASGATVYFVQTHGLPILDIQVMFNAGSAWDPQEHYGLAWLVNQTMNEGTKNKSANDIADGFDASGANFSSNVDREQAYLQLRTMTDSKYLNPALALFHDVLVNATFPDVELARIKNQTISLIQSMQEQPDSVALDAFYHGIYDGESYAHPPYGVIENVQTMSRQDVLQFYRQYYVARNAKIIIVGEVTRDQANTIATNLLADLPQGSVATALPKAQSQVNHTLSIAFPSTQANIYMGQIGITHLDPNYFPLVVGNAVLGEGATMSSRLFHVIRNQHALAYSVESAFIPASYRGPFVIVLETRADQAPLALKLIHDTLDDFIQNGPTAKELADAKDYLIGRFPILLSSNTSILKLVSMIALYNLPLDYMDHYRSNVSAVTPEQVKQAFANTIHPTQMMTVIVGAKS